MNRRHAATVLLFVGIATFIVPIFLWLSMASISSYEGGWLTNFLWFTAFLTGVLITAGSLNLLFAKARDIGRKSLTFGVILLSLWIAFFDCEIVLSFLSERSDSTGAAIIAAVMTGVLVLSWWMVSLILKESPSLAD